MGDWDAARLQTVVGNLIDNAIKFGDGKPIEVELDGNGEAAVLTVRDHGAGVSTEAAEGVFGRYERDVSTRTHGGLGLGLYVARGIVLAHGGTIRATSHPGDGTMVTVEIPYQSARAETEARDEEGPRPHRG